MDYDKYLPYINYSKLLYTFNANGSKNFFWDYSNYYNILLQFFFHLNRIENKEQQNIILNIHLSLLFNLQDKPEENLLLYKLIAFTRDIHQGKGEYYLSYLMLFNLFEYEIIKKTYNFEYGYRMIDEFVGYNNNLKKPLGSWKDIKNIIKMCKENFKNAETGIILENYFVKIINSQLKKDLINMNLNKKCSLLAKWIPREKKIYKDFYENLVLNYYKLSNNDKKQDITFYKKQYRKNISKLNNYIETVEIKLCENNRKQINLEKIPKKALLNYSLSFMNIAKTGEKRVLSKNHYDKSIMKKKFNLFVKDNCIDAMSKSQIMDDYLIIQYALLNGNDKNKQFINQLWENNKKLINNQNENYLPVVDISLKNKNFMKYCSSIAIGIRIAEISNLGKRIMYFGNDTYWLNIENLKLTEILSNITKINDSFSDIKNVLEVLVENINNTILTEKQISRLTIFIISDMNFTPIDKDNSLLIPYLKEKFDTLSRDNYLYTKHPHVVFWNQKCENHFIGKGDEENISFLSGFNTSHINWIKKNKKTNNVNKFNYTCPYFKLKSILNQPRYKIFNEYMPCSINL